MEFDKMFAICFVIAVCVAVPYACGVYNSDKEYAVREAQIAQKQSHEDHRHEEAMKPNNSHVDRFLRWVIK